MVNKVMLIGNLGADPEVRRLESGVAVARLNIATTEKYKDRNGESQSQTEWHTVVVWRQLAELAEQYLKKGRQVYIEGKLTHRKWQDKDGNTRYTTEVVANNFRMLGSREGGGSGYSSNFPSAQDAPPAQQKSTAPATKPATPAAKAPAAESAGEEDLPF